MRNGGSLACTPCHSARRSASTSNMVLDAYSISPGASYVSPELAGVTLAGGDAIYALAAVGSVNLMINGVVIV